MPPSTPAAFSSADSAAPTPRLASEGAPTGVPLIDMERQYRPLAAELMAAIQKVCDSGKFVLGPECVELEQSLSKYLGHTHALACASGSDALLLALMAIDVGPGDDVLLPSFTFFATAGAVARLGARPVFVDIDPVDFNLDPDRLEEAITPATKAILPVHLYGQCAPMRPILDFAARHGLVVIEDAAQAIGAEYHDTRAGTLGDMACFSFYPTKNLGGFGDGGLITTPRADLAEKLKLLRAHGMQPRYYHRLVGINSRLDSIQAAVLNVKFPRLDEWTRRRQEVAQRYDSLFAAHGGHRLSLPAALPFRRHVWNQYVVRVPNGQRDALRKHLGDRRIGTEIYYPVPLHEQECFRYLGYERGSLPETELAARETLALPIFPELTAAEQTLVVTSIVEFYEGLAKSPATAFTPRAAA